MPSTAAETAAIDTALSKLSRLATLPEVTTRILELIDNPSASADELEKLVCGDPVLSARVLKVVNSSFYGIPAHVTSIKQAIMLIGLGGLKSVALAASLAKLFGGVPIQADFDPQGPWQHSAAVAAAAKLISDETGADGDEMFVAGLLHDVGTVIALQVLRNEFIEMVEFLAQNPGEAFHEAEKRFLGATHEAFGLALCRSWNFPASIQAAVEFHHRPEECDPEFRRAAQIICVADHLAAELKIGFCNSVDDRSMPTAVVRDLGLSDESLERIRERMSEAVGLADQMAA